MMDDQPSLAVDGQAVTDPPTPDLEDLEQREPLIPAVAVRHEGAVHVHLLPATRSAVDAFPLTTTLAKVLGNDRRRSRVVLCSSVVWRYARTATGNAAVWPASVPLTLTHCDDIYARSDSGAGTLTVIMEIYGD